jgi:hypothetical protein
MSEKLTPPSKTVARKDGIKMGSSDTTLTTPNPTFGRYFGGNQSGASTKEPGSLFRKK